MKILLLELKRKKLILKIVKYATEQAKISSYIESMPDKYNTIFGEGGSKLSGGQKQNWDYKKLYKSPQILVLMKLLVLIKQV